MHMNELSCRELAPAGVRFPGIIHPGQCRAAKQWHCAECPGCHPLLQYTPGFVALSCQRYSVHSLMSSSVRPVLAEVSTRCVSAAQTRCQTSTASLAGLIGTAPSAELLAIWNEREGALVDAGESAITLGSCLHTRPLGASEMRRQREGKACHSCVHADARLSGGIVSTLHPHF